MYCWLFKLLVCTLWFDLIILRWKFIEIPLRILGSTFEVDLLLGQQQQDFFEISLGLTTEPSEIGLP